MKINNGGLSNLRTRHSCIGSLKILSTKTDSLDPMIQNFSNSTNWITGKLISVKVWPDGNCCWKAYAFHNLRGQSKWVLLIVSFQIQLNLPSTQANSFNEKLLCGAGNLHVQWKLLKGITIDVCIWFMWSIFQSPECYMRM